MKPIRAASAISILLFTWSQLMLAQRAAGGSVPATGAQAAFVPVTDAMLPKPDPADWLMWRRTLDSWGYSPLNQINRTNVSQLGWSGRAAWPTGYPGSHAAGLRRRHVSAQSRRLHSGPQRQDRRFDLGIPAESRRPRRGQNRNIAIYGNPIIDTSADDFVFALNAQTGKLAWETQILDPKNPAARSSGPIIANGKIFPGRGCESEVRSKACVITAHDAKTGKELWRVRTIPKPGEPGNETWGGIPYEAAQARRHLDAAQLRSRTESALHRHLRDFARAQIPAGGNDKKYLYHNCTLAIDADTGKIVWYYQHIVDHWDLDHPFERILVDTAVAPDPAQVAGSTPRSSRANAEGTHRDSRQNGNRLHARPPDRRISVGPPTVIRTSCQDRWQPPAK